MDYRKYGNTVYIRMDKGDEIITGILDICGKEGIRSAVFSGIGGCSEAQIQTFVPQAATFETRKICGMLELVSLNGNIVTDEQNERYAHTHAMFAYKDGDKHLVAGGHLKSVTVLYTAEIELRPVIEGRITRQFHPETGTGIWNFA